MNVPESVFCSGCGRQLGLEPVAEGGSLACPLCKQSMQLYREGAGVLLDCGVCGGQFVEHVLLREMLHRQAALAIPEAVVQLARRPDPRTNYIPCPECSALMNRKNFGTTSGVVVDVCKKHGTWFDEGELPRVLAFVAGGGLERAHAREAEETARLRHDAAVASAPASHMPVWSERGVSSGRESLVEMFLEFLH